MKTAYKWRLTNTKYAYITDENGLSGKPFIYETSTSERRYSDGTTSIGIVKDTIILRLVGAFDETTYKTKFDEMVFLIGTDDDRRTLLNYSYYYNINNDSCVAVYGDNEGKEGPEGPMGMSVVEVRGMTSFDESGNEYEEITFFRDSSEGEIVPLKNKVKVYHGRSGEQGAQGVQGPKGEPGPAGTGTTINSSTKIVYAKLPKGTEARDVEAPRDYTIWFEGSSWNFQDNGGMWFDSLDSTSEDDEMWICFGTFNYSTTADIIKNGAIWSKPANITGRPGADSVSNHYIYLPSAKEIKIEGYKFNPPKFNGSTAPKGQEDGGEWVQWNESPSGIDTNKRFEYIAYSQYDMVTKSWGSWNGPVLWSKWGEDGTDGDGVAYIYCSTSVEITDNEVQKYNPTPEGYKTDENYQKNDDFAPSSSFVNVYGKQLELSTLSGLTWYDIPQGTSPDFPYQYASIRKFRKEDGDTKNIWQQFSDPKLWTIDKTKIDVTLTSKIVYPAGEWDENVEYKSDSKSTPYVTRNSKMYVLAVETSKGDKPEENPEKWTGGYEQKDIVYTKLLLADNALVGQAVFNGDYMFSQAGRGGANNYQDFWKYDPYGKLGINVVTTYTTKGGISGYVEGEKTAEEIESIIGEEVKEGSVVVVNKPSNAFIPNWCVNFKTGEMWAGGGTFNVTPEGRMISTDAEIEGTIQSNEAIFGSKDSGNPYIEIKNGLMSIFGNGGHANIRFGIDSDGYSVLTYYDNEGTRLYDLGPKGIMWLIDEEKEKTLYLTTYLYSNPTRPQFSWNNLRIYVEGGPTIFTELQNSSMHKSKQCTYIKEGYRLVGGYKQYYDRNAKPPFYCLDDKPEYCLKGDSIVYYDGFISETAPIKEEEQKLLEPGLYYIVDGINLSEYADVRIGQIDYNIYKLDNSILWSENCSVYKGDGWENYRSEKYQNGVYFGESESGAIYFCYMLYDKYDNEEFHLIPLNESLEQWNIYYMEGDEIKFWDLDTFRSKYENIYGESLPYLSDFTLKTYINAAKMCNWC